MLITISNKHSGECIGSGEQHPIVDVKYMAKGKGGEGETRFVVTHLREPQQERNKGMVE